MKSLANYAAGFTAATLLFAAHSYLEQGHGLHPIAAAIVLAVHTAAIVYINKSK